MREDSRSSPLESCGCCWSRRRFLAGCAGCAGAAAPRAVFGARPSRRKLRLHLLFAVHAPVQDRPTWPHMGFDFRPVMQRIRSELVEACPEFEFMFSTAADPEAAAKIIKEGPSESVDGYIVYQLNNWVEVVQTCAATGKPVLFLDFPYGGSGGFLLFLASLLRSHRSNVGFVASSGFDDHVAAVKCFEVIQNGGSPADFVAATERERKRHTPPPGNLSTASDPVALLPADQWRKHFRQSKILAVGGGSRRGGEAVERELGTRVVFVEFGELDQAWKNADKDQAGEIADRWQEEATKVEGVSREELEKSASMYLAQKAMIERHGANAISIHCLGGFYGGHIHAYPCLGFVELSNQGLIGGCECDIDSAATMVALTAMTQGRPGFISDPVIDTAKRRIIYAHCVAPNKPFGPKGPANDFEIFTHSEDRKGAAVRSIFPTGYMLTTLKFGPDRKQVVLHQAKSIDNIWEDRACRTKLCAEPIGDIERLFTEWDRWGWHRVTFFGDLKEPVYTLAEMLGWQVIEEA
ncbi:MAG TPA: hypothetical protein P5568_01550 [Acidobacteriota bacterium]|nr:hypothetical protein [Acidobacteriota bacterium]